MQPLNQHQPTSIILGQISPQIAAETNSTVPQTACHHHKPETSLDWEEQFVDLTSYCSSHTPMALIPDEDFAVTSQATEQRNGPDVFFGNDSIGNGLEMMLVDQPSYDLLYKDSPRGELIDNNDGGDGEEGSGVGVSGGLKLNVDSGHETADLLNTPDVIKAFDDVESFDLIEYVFNEDKKPNLFELDKQIEQQQQQQQQHQQQYNTTQDSTSNLSFLTKSNLSNHHLQTTKSIGKQLNTTKPSSNSNAGNINKPKQIATIRPKRIKQKKMFSDYIYDNIISIKKEDQYDDRDDNNSSDDYLATIKTTKPNKRLLTLPARKRNISCSSSSTIGSTLSNKKRRLTDDEDILEYESGKYRELRNRNNEASRRSRANRKQKEIKMKEYADNLINDNIRLKNKAIYLEQQVEKFRRSLMKIVLSNKKKDSR